MHHQSAGAATFDVRWPKRNTIRFGPRTTENVPARMLTVLVVDPATDVVESISDQLHADGFKIQHAVDGEDALDVFKRSQPDLVLLELQLPKVNGLDVLREIRRLSDVPTIIVSDRAGEADRIVGLELGADDFLAKPCSPRELLARIGALVRRSRCECGNVRSLQLSRRSQDAITIDRGRHQVMRGNEVLKLTATEFRMRGARKSRGPNAHAKPGTRSGCARFVDFRSHARQTRCEFAEENRSRCDTSASLNHDFRRGIPLSLITSANSSYEIRNTA